MSSKGYFMNSDSFVIDLASFTTHHRDLLGGTLDKWMDHWKDEINKIGDNVEGFFEKLAEDIKHFPEDLKKAVEDFKNEMKRFGMAFKELMYDAGEKIKEILESIPTPEELGKKLALKHALMFKEKTENDSSKLCAGTIGGLLMTIGAVLKLASQGAPNPYADYLIAYGPVAALWGCTEAYK